MGTLMLCKRHHNMMKDLVDRNIPITKWPSQLIRGMVYHTYEMLEHEKRQLDATKRDVNNAQNRVNALSSQPTTIQKIFPMPVFGMGWSPLGGAESITGYNFFYPMSVSRPNTEVQQRLAEEQKWLSNWKSNLEQENKQMSETQANHALYNQVLQDLVKQFPPRFKSCLACGQSEIFLGENSCPYCGGNNLATEVDPEEVVLEYENLISATTTGRREKVIERALICPECKVISTIHVPESITNPHCPNCNALILDSYFIEYKNLDASRMRKEGVDMNGDQPIVNELLNKVPALIEKFLAGVDTPMEDYDRFSMPTASYTMLWWGNHWKQASLYNIRAPLLKRLHELHQDMSEHYREEARKDAKLILNTNVFYSEYISKAGLSNAHRVESAVIHNCIEAKVSISIKLDEEIHDGMAAEIKWWNKLLESKGLLAKFKVSEKHIRDNFIVLHPEFGNPKAKYDTGAPLDAKEKEIIPLMEVREELDRTWIKQIEYRENHTNHSLKTSEWNDIWLELQKERTGRDDEKVKRDQQEAKESKIDLAVLKYCSNCGEAITKKNARFCVKCGSSFARVGEN